MAKSGARASGLWRRGDNEVSLAQLYVLRAVFLFFAVDGIFNTLPFLFDHGPTDRGMILGIKAGLCVMGFFGVRYPLQMLPILLFEFVWKTIWLSAFGLPQWRAGVGAPTLHADLIGIALVPLSLSVLLMPWGYVWRHYVKKCAERWS
jgi:hypothetical protein